MDTDIAMLELLPADADENADEKQPVAGFFQAVRHGPQVLAALPGVQHAVVQAEIAAAFRGVFLTVACFSCTIVVMAWTLPVRRL